MSVSGIICEYNPFHNGHKYQIEKTRELTGCDKIIALMSGDFVQRGAPAFIDKYDRVRMALSCGADIVLGMPAVSSLQSAEGFALSGVAILNSLGAIDTISFGCECDGTGILKDIAAVLSDEPGGYRQLLAEYLGEGLSFPAAREKALCRYFKKDTPLEEILKSPNNILAIEYLKAIDRLGSSLRPCFIKRESSFPSSSAIRESVKCTGEIPAGSMPAGAAGVMQEKISGKEILFEDDFSDMLFYALSLCAREEEKDSDLKRRALNLFEKYRSFSLFAELLKTKNITYTAVSRFLVKTMLGITPEKENALKNCSYAPYVRVLGMRESAKPLFAAICKESSIPVIARPAEDMQALSLEQREIFDIDMRAARLWQYVAGKVSGREAVSDYRRKLIVL